MTPAQFLTTTPLGTRVVVRSKIEGGFTDALGYLRERSEADCTVETRRGLKTLALNDVVLAKAVPEPPSRRRPPTPG